MDLKSLPLDRLSPVVNRPEWDVFLVWVSNRCSDCHERLETCDPERLKLIQGQLNILKDILTLRENVNKFMNVRNQDSISRTVPHYKDQA